MAGLVLSIAVLASGTILPNVEDMKPTVDISTGIKIQCKIPNGGSNEGRLDCNGFSKDGLSSSEVTIPGEEPTFTAGNCSKSRTTSGGPVQIGVYLFTFWKCTGGESSNFVVTVDENLEITNVVVGGV